MLVNLEWYEIEKATFVGIRRTIESIKMGLKDAHGYTGKDPWEMNCLGACGEYATAKLLDRPWSGSINTFKAADIGEKIQVRSSKRIDAPLIVRPNDDPDHFYFLAIATHPYLKQFDIVGYIQGKVAQAMPLSDNGNGRKPVHFIKQEQLQPVARAIRER